MLRRLVLIYSIVFIVVLICYWQVLKYNTTARKLAAINNIINMGGLVRSADDHGSRRLFQHLFGVEYYAHVTDVILSDCPIEDVDITVLSDLNWLLNIDISGTMVTDVGVEYLVEHTHLRKLNLARTGITDVGVSPIANLHDLEELNLDGTIISDQGLELLAGMRSLRKLSVSGTKVTEGGVRLLRQSLPLLQTVEYVATLGPHKKCPARQRPPWGMEEDRPEESEDLKRLRASDISVIIKELHNDNWLNRKTASESLGDTGTYAPEAVDALIDCLSLDSDPLVRMTAAESLGKIHPDANIVVPPLVKALQDSSVLVRMAAAQSLGTYGSEASTTVPSLINLLADHNADVRCAAAKSLGEIGYNAIIALPHLNALLQDDDRLVKYAAKEALKKITEEQKENRSKK